MSILSFLNELDQSIFFFLNGFYNDFWDFVMMMLTRKEIWLPLYISLIFLCIKKYRFKSILILIFIILSVVISDQSSFWIKELTQRLRPIHDPMIADSVHNFFKKGGSYGFFSSHASNVFAVAFLTSKLFNNKTFSITIFFWAIIVSYTRIYLGVHYPFDILTGVVWGCLIGYLIYKLLQTIERKLIWASYPNIAKTKLSAGESICFTLIFMVMIAVIMLVIWKLQHYNYL